MQTAIEGGMRNKNDQDQVVTFKEIKDIKGKDIKERLKFLKKNAYKIIS